MLLSSISGGGANIVTVPLLILIYHFPVNDAIGTAFLSLLIGTLAGTASFSLLKQVDYRHGIILGFVSLPGVIAGSLFTTSMSNFIAKIFLIIVIETLGALFLVNAFRGARSGNKTGMEYVVRMRYSLIMFLLGFFVGAFGLGGGLILIPIMTFLGFPILRALGTSKLVGILLTAGAFSVRFSLSQVNISFALFLGIGALTGGLLGPRIVTMFDSSRLKILVAVVVFSLGLLLLVQT